jgi:sialate O-acetylesterase
VVAVRIFSHLYAGGFIGNAGQMRLGPAGSKDSEAIPLAGDWQYRVEANFGKINPQPPPAPLGNGNPNTPASLFNGMIAPLLPYPIRGAIWYQGESNAGRAHQYGTLFPAMIRDWRRAWGMPAPAGDFAFHFVQLANYMPEQPKPGESAWAELREAQRLTLREPNTGMAVTIDIGDGADIHPTNKQDVGRRLAYSALVSVYGQRLAGSGPVLKSWEPRDGVMRVSFDRVDGGLVTHDGGAVRGFTVAGADRVFHWAWARIEGNTVMVRHPHVANPAAVRYAWADNPACNLCNGAGLPASPFKTDDWPWTTQPKG